MTNQKLTPRAKGAPPCVGVWNASRQRERLCFRYWDGTQYGGAGTSPELAVAFYKDGGRCSYPEIIEWRGLAEQPK